LGQEAARRAQERLMGYVLSSHAAMIVKEKDGTWLPVGEEDLYAIIPMKDGRIVLVLCDGDGYAKAMSDPLDEQQMDRAIQRLRSDGLSLYQGKITLPV